MLQDPGGPNVDAYQKLFIKREDWARKKRLDADAKNADSMDIGEVNDDEGHYKYGGDKGYYDQEGSWWEWTA